MTSKREDLVFRIKKIKDTIRKKHRTLKNRLSQSERDVEIKFKPLIEPIKQLMEKKIKIEKQEQGLEEEEEEELEEPNTDWSAYITSNNIGYKVGEYLKKFIADDVGDYDLTYGIKWNNITNEWKLGQHTVTFQGDNFVIDSVTYPATDGLLQLVFMKEPVNYNKNDLDTYKNILIQTKAHLKSDGKVNSNSGFKYKNIIKKLFPPRKDGRGMSLSISHQPAAPMMDLTSSRIDYRHWDDPNELVDRLRLLYASKQAGNTGHSNEIISIFEELQEAGIIKDFSHVKL